MTDDRKRNTGGEVERYKPEIVPNPDKPYIHFHYDPEGRWMLYRDHNRALAESRAEVEQVREAYENRTRDWYAQSDAYDQLRARAERLAGALVALTSPICSEEEDAEAHRLARAALNLEPNP